MERTEFLVEYSLSDKPESVRKITISGNNPMDFKDLQRLVTNIVSQLMPIPDRVSIKILSFKEKNSSMQVPETMPIPQMPYTVEYERLLRGKTIYSGKIVVYAKSGTPADEVAIVAKNTIQTTISYREQEIRIIGIS